MLYLLSARISFLDRADNFFLTCPFKYLTGYDCPGCGFQRALLALLKGNLQESLHMYPATIPLLVTFIVAVPANYLAKSKSDKLIKVLYLITGTVILISYLFKMFAAHPH